MNTLPKWIKIGWILGRVAGWPLSWFRQRPCLLVIHSGSLGDGLLFTGAIRELRKHEPRKHIVLVVSERAYPLFQRCPHVNQVVAFAKGTDWWAKVKRVIQAARLFARPYDAVLSPDVQPGAIEASSQDPRLKTYGGWGDVALMLLAEVDYTSDSFQARMDPFVPHQLDRIVRFMQFYGYGDIKTRKDVWPETYVTHSERAHAASEIGQLRRQYSEALIVAVCAGARFKQKDWGSRNFVELFARLAETKPVVLLLLGAADDSSGNDDIVKGLRKKEGVKVLNMAGQVGLHASMALIEQSDICVGNDTFGLHVAIAVGTPSVVVMWGGDHERWTPWGDSGLHKMVRSVDCACFGCRGDCKQSEYRCMTGIAVGDVLREMLSLPMRTVP